MKQTFNLFSQQQRQRAIEAIKNVPDDFVAEIKQKTRSIEQNALLWRLLTITAKNVTWSINGKSERLSPTDWKDIFSASLHQEQRIAKGINGGFVMLGKSTSQMTIAQMTELIEFIYSFLAEHGVVVDVEYCNNDV